MKLTQFKQIIREEIRKAIRENRSFQTTGVKDPLNVKLPDAQVAASVQDRQRIKTEIEATLTKAFQDIANKYGQHMKLNSYARCSWYTQPEEDYGGTIEISSMLQFIAPDQTV